MKRTRITMLCMAFVQALFGQTHWTPATGFQSNMVMSAVLYVNGEEQSLKNVEIGAFCGEECRAAELPMEFMGEYVYFLTIVGTDNDLITFRLWDHQSDEELDYVCDQTYTFVVDDILGDYPDWYQIHFTAPIISIKITATAEPVEGGTPIGAGTYNYGDEVTISVKTNEDWGFLDWTENGAMVTEDQTFTFIATADRHFVARLASTVGIDEQSGSNVHIYPNPVNRFEPFNLVVSEDEEIAELIVVNASGAVVRHETGTISRNSIMGLPVTGLYMVRVMCKSGKMYQSRLIVI